MDLSNNDKFPRFIILLHPFLIPMAIFEVHPMVRPIIYIYITYHTYTVHGAHTQIAKVAPRKQNA